MLDRKNERGMCLFRVSSPNTTPLTSDPSPSNTSTNTPKVLGSSHKSRFWKSSANTSNSQSKAKLEDGEVLAVFVAAKSHSKMNPVKIAARIRWMNDEVWNGNGGEWLKIAAFLAVMTFGEKRYAIFLFRMFCLVWCFFANGSWVEG